MAGTYLADWNVARDGVLGPYFSYHAFQRRAHGPL